MDEITVPCKHIVLTRVVVGDWAGYKCAECGTLFACPDPVVIRAGNSD